MLQSCSQAICKNIQILLGGFETKMGEQVVASKIRKCVFFCFLLMFSCYGGTDYYTCDLNTKQWLAFRNDGKYSAADYAKASCEKVSKNRDPKEPKFWNPFEEEQFIKRKRYYIVKLLHGALCGLAYMHANERLHQSLGPASVVLKYVTIFVF